MPLDVVSADVHNAWALLVILNVLWTAHGTIAGATSAVLPVVEQDNHTLFIDAGGIRTGNWF